MNKILTVVLSVAILLTGMVFMSGCNEVNHKALEIKIGSEVKEFNTIDDSVLEYINAETEDVVKIKLHKDLELPRGIMLKNNEFELNLNGNDISMGEGFTQNYVICVNNGASLTINGKGVVNASTQTLDQAIAVWAYNGEVVINGGTFTNAGTKAMEDDETTPNNNELIYASNVGVITINGGKFIGNYENETFGTQYALNVRDADLSTAQIIVKGGEYRQYNPAASLSENPQANFVADGFQSVENVRNGVKWYVVSAIED